MYVGILVYYLKSQCGNMLSDNKSKNQKKVTNLINRTGCECFISFVSNVSQQNFELIFNVFGFWESVIEKVAHTLWLNVGKHQAILNVTRFLNPEQNVQCLIVAWQQKPKQITTHVESREKAVHKSVQHLKIIFMRDAINFNVNLNGPFRFRYNITFAIVVSIQQIDHVIKRYFIYIEREKANEMNREKPKHQLTEQKCSFQMV